VLWTWSEGACNCWLPGALACCTLALVAMPCHVQTLDPPARGPRSSNPRGRASCAREVTGCQPPPRRSPIFVKPAKPQAAWSWLSSRARAFVGTGGESDGVLSARGLKGLRPIGRGTVAGRWRVRTTQARAGGVVLAGDALGLGSLPLCPCSWSSGGARLHASRR